MAVSTPQNYLLHSLVWYGVIETNSTDLKVELGGITKMEMVRYGFKIL